MNKSYKIFLPVFVLVVISLIPIVRCFFLEPIGLRFFDLNSTTTSIGQITGLLGMILFALNLILSNRSIYFDKIFSGLHRFYFIHRWLGAFSFSLLLFHPIFLVVKYVSVSLRSAAIFFLPVQSFALNMGVIGLALMIILLVITLHYKIKYHTWRLSHKFMNLVFVFAIFHVFSISSDISRDNFLRYYILTFSFIGLAFGIYRSFLRKYFNKDYEYAVENVKSLNSDVVELKIKSLSGEMKFNPGQFIFIRFVDNGISSEPHPFSVSSSIFDNNIELVIKSLGDYTSFIKDIKIGTKIMVEGPFGMFFENDNPVGKEVWIAGGVGITPFLSMARSLKEGNYNVDLYYSVGSNGEAVLISDLEDISNKNKNFHVIPWYSKENGRINAEMISQRTTNIKDCKIYICGPLNFMRSLKDQFIKININSNQIIFEEFDFLE